MYMYVFMSNGTVSTGVTVNTCSHGSVALGPFSDEAYERCSSA